MCIQIWRSPLKDPLKSTRQIDQSTQPGLDPTRDSTDSTDPEEKVFGFGHTLFHRKTDLPSVLLVRDFIFSDFPVQSWKDAACECISWPKRGRGGFASGVRKTGESAEVPQPT